MILVFIHGWSVTSTETYGGLPEALAAQAATFGLDLDIRQVWLGRYISFDDNVTMVDIVTGLDRALHDTLTPNGGELPEFSCITHSTGGPIAREWINAKYGADKLKSLPLKHLVMLAPANHGSPLALLGKERVGRIKAFFSGIEPGERILQWLALGSAPQWELSKAWLNYDGPANGFFPFVLTGQTIDTSFYDFLNNYLTEVGSDGVVRSAGANMNYRMLDLVETTDTVTNSQFKPQKAFALAVKDKIADSPVCGFGVIPDASHSGADLGIMNSVTPGNASAKPVVEQILKCLGVQSAQAYGSRCQELDQLTTATQAADTRSKGQRYTCLVFKIVDDQGEPVNDFDLFLLAGPKYSPDKMPPGFFVDRQRNAETPNCLVYYVDYDTTVTMPKQQFGIRVVGRPAKGLARYFPVEFRADGATLAQALRPSETVYIQITLTRHVHDNVFTFVPATDPRKSFKSLANADG